MEIDWVYPAKFIYWIYSHFCHQLAYRSWFLFGMQPFYPLYPNENVAMITYQKAFGFQADNIDFARSVIGNGLFGYKMAICQRDMAMYGLLLFFGLIYLFTGKKLKRIPFPLWIVLGILPLGLDGIFQFLGSKQIQIPFIGVWESTPWIRTITGGLFGIFTGWFIYPSFDLFQERKNEDFQSLDSET